jgi:hypothetical protein
MATGETAEGRAPKSIMVSLVPILSDPTLPPVDKLRLLMTYIIASEGIQDLERRRLLEQSSLSLDDSQALVNLAALNVKLSATGKRGARSQGRYTYSGSHKLEKHTNNKKASDEGASYDLSRYVPIHKQVIRVRGRGVMLALVLLVAGSHWQHLHGARAHPHTHTHAHMHTCTCRTK